MTLVKTVGLPVCSTVLLQVPANRIGYGVLHLSQLKILQVRP